MAAKMQTIMTMIRIMMRPTNGAVVPTTTAFGGCELPERKEGAKEYERFSKCSRKEKKCKAVSKCTVKWEYMMMTTEL